MAENDINTDASTSEDSIFDNNGIYIPQNWQDTLEQFTVFSPERMNHIEQGIKQNSEKIKENWDSISQYPIDLDDTVIVNRNSSQINVFSYNLTQINENLFSVNATIITRKVLNGALDDTVFTVSKEHCPKYNFGAACYYNFDILGCAILTDGKVTIRQNGGQLPSGAKISFGFVYNIKM